MFQKKESSDLRESCFWQVCASATKVCGELNLRRKKLIPNIVIPFANSNFIRKTLYNTKKSDFGRFQFVASKVLFWRYSFCDAYWDIYHP